ncbi:hypothetical protein BT96DRAFT_913801 [Gymnopus androsaceus JB14]|uniref:Uncharacterized protein n=1 Tax=Gymnopus androsaceus JB14 TaxID=1447944 RepID=A0A6A4IF89_9AGAR|nr:hypothetical protein BT96DRAFT_913801 [Gymnopus androsaceus JB14]
MSFKSFRQILSAIFLCRSFVSSNGIWIIGTLELALFVLFANSAISKLLFKHQISVMQEICSSFAAFALGTVLALFVVSLPVNDKEIAQVKNMDPIMRVWVRIVITIMFALNMAMLTHFSFDKNVWKRDIDSSPTPFPFPIIETTPVIRPPCITGICECPTKQVVIPQESNSNEPKDTSAPTLSDKPRASMPSSETRLSVVSRRSSITTSQSLIQVPNAAQRRMSFPLTLTMWADEMEDV